MKIARIEFKNIMSYGNVPTIIDGLLDDPAMWLIIGENGSGKSALIKVLKLGLYLKTDGIAKNKIANSINKNGYIRIDCINNSGENWIVESYWSPNRIKVYKGEEINDDTFVDKGSIDNTLAFIQDHIVGIPYYIFNNIINLDIRDFKSFLNMKADDARNIRDRLLGFYVVNEMNRIFKESIKETNDSFNRISVVIEEKQQNIEKIKAKIDELHSTDVEELNKKKSELELSKDDLIKKVGVALDAVELSKKEHNEYREQMESIIHKELLSEYTKFDIQLQELLGSIDTDTERIDKIVSDRLDFVEMKKFFDVKKLKDDVKRIEKEAVEVTSKYEAVMIQLDTATESLDRDKKKLFEIDQKIKEIEKYENNIKLINEIIPNISLFVDNEKLTIEAVELEEQSTAKSNVINKEIIEIENEIASIRTFMKLIEQGECPTCHTSFDSPDFLSDVEAKELRLNELTHSLNSKLESNDKINKLVVKIESKKLEAMGKAEALNNKITPAINYLHLSSDDRTDMVKTVEYFEGLKVKCINLIKEKPENTISITEQTEAVSQFSDKKIKLFGEQQQQLTEKKNIQAKISEIGEVNIDNNKAEEVDDIGEHIKMLSKSYENVNTILQNSKISSAELKTKVAGIKIMIDASKPEKEYDDIKLTKEEISAKMAELDITIEKNNSTYGELNQEQELIKSKLDEVISQIESGVNKYESILKEENQKLDDTDDEFRKLQRKKHYNSHIERALGEKGGIKSHIIREIIPFVNVMTNDFLDIYNIPLTVDFDDQFKPKIYRANDEADINSISVGQTAMINFCIVLTMTMIIHDRYGGINMVVYDELLGTLDEKRKPSTLTMLTDVCIHRLGMHVFVINQTPLLTQFFDKTLKVELIDGFAEATISSGSDMFFGDGNDDEVLISKDAAEITKE